MRYAFIKTLTNKAKKNKDIFLLTGDLGFTVFEEFQDMFPDRFINVGVAEQNLVGIAAGLALTGKKVFVYSIATFASMRPFEQIRTDVAAHKLPVVIVGSGAGLSYADNALTHHATEDINLMRGIPDMIVFCPADPIETEWATKQAISSKLPVYLRLGKRGEPHLYQHPPKLAVGKASVITAGTQVAIIATGNIVYNVLEATQLLKKRNIHPLLVSMHTVKPIDKNFIRRIAKAFSLIVTVEEHSIIGGLGSAVAEIIAEHASSTKLIRIGIPDVFLYEIGSQQYLRERVGLNPQKIARTILRQLKT